MTILQARIFKILQCLVLLCLLSGTKTAFAVDLNDSCDAGTGPGSGIITDVQNSTCTDTSTLSQGALCSGSTYYNSATGSCVANNASCTINTANDGIYSGGSCQAVPTPPTPTTPTSTNFTTIPGSGVAPSGSQQPVCVNASPFIGGGFGIVSGTVLCYSGAGENSNIYAYEVSNGGWNGLNVEDVYARGDITVSGTLSTYQGALLLSPNDKSGVSVSDNGVLLASFNATNGGSTINTTATGITLDSRSDNTANSAYSQLTLDDNQGAKLLSKSDTGSEAALTLSGIAASGNTSKTGVKITGDGNGAGTGTVSAAGVANWADVAIVSKNYVSGTSGSAIIVNDYGVQIIAPPLSNGGVSTNSFGSGEANTSGSTVNNNIGLGGAGTVNNNFGSGGNSSTSVVNNSFGAGGGASGSTVTNTIGAAGVTGSVTTNNFGTSGSGGATINNFGNTNNATTITSQAGSSTMQMSNGLINMTTGSTLATNGIYGESSGIQGRDSAVGSGGMNIYSQAQTIAANTTIANHLANKQYQNKINGNLYVDGNVYINGTLDYVASESATTTVSGAGVGTSILAGATQGTVGSSGIVLKGSNASYTAVDANGKLIATSGVAAQSSASLTLTNGYGNTHGLIVTENQATLSGGSHSTSLTLDDNGARFSNAQTGDPVKVTGVADGTGDFDAVNVRQLGRGVAMVSALAGMPQVDPGKTFNIAAGVGHYLGHAALSMGGGWRPNDATVVKIGVSAATSGDAMANGGVGFSW